MIQDKEEGRKGKEKMRGPRESQNTEKRGRETVCVWEREREIGERGERDTIECACVTFPKKVVCNKPKFTTWSSTASIRIPPPYQSDALSYKTAGG
jgi:hypothetical protein